MRVVPPLVAMATSLVALTASAGPREQCIADAETGQLLRDKSHFLEAKKRFIACSASACPEVVQTDCQAFLRALEPRIPSVVLVAKDNVDADLVDVSVTMDGALLVPRLNAFAVEVDPGTHVFRFERAAGAAVETRVLVREWEKGRAVRVVIPSTAISSPDGPSAPTSSGVSRVPTLSWILGGVAVVGGASFAALFLSANADVRDRERTCAPFCSADRVSPIETKYVLGDVALGVGGAAAVGAIVSYFLLAKDATPPATGRARPPYAAE